MSRCQHYAFRRIPAPEIAETLKGILKTEKIKYEDEAVNLVARLADGALRDAESILDQLIAFDRSNLSLENCRKVLGTVDEDLLFELAEAVLKTDSGGIINATEGFATAGRDFTLVLKDLTGLFRDSLIASLDESTLKGEGSSEEYIKRAKTLRGTLSVDSVSKIIASLAKKSGEMRYELEKRILFETCLLELAQRLARVMKVPVKTETHPTPPGKGRASAVATAPGAVKETSLPDIPPDIPLPGDDHKEASPVDAKPVETPAAPVVQTPLVEDTIEVNDPVKEWDNLLKMVARSSIAKAVILSKGSPISFNDDILRIEYEPHATLMGNGLNEPQIKDELERIIGNILDKQVMIEVAMKRPDEEGSQAGLFEGEGNPDVVELKGIIDEQIIKKFGSARIRHIGEIKEK